MGTILVSIGKYRIEVQAVSIHVKTNVNFNWQQLRNGSVVIRSLSPSHSDKR